MSNVNNGYAELVQAIQYLRFHWETTTTMWNDTVSETFEENYLHSILDAAESTADAINEVVEIARNMLGDQI